MFSRILIERELQGDPKVRRILSQYPKIPMLEIESYEQVFGRVRKPYLDKRDSLQLILAKKKGRLVKETPAAYGFGKGPHYYFVHSYNCVYECNYCYLQGYFDSPDIILFLNHGEIFDQIRNTAFLHPSPEEPWFHAGEYSDSLALSHLSGELMELYELFDEIPHARLEIRTKSVNLKEILKLKPRPNISISYSLAPQKRIAQNEDKTPRIKARLNAMKSLYEKGHLLGVHFDPIIWSPTMGQDYLMLLEEMNHLFPLDHVSYFSLGVVRFTPDVHYQVQKNYGRAEFLNHPMIVSKDGKIRYSRVWRMQMLNEIRNQLRSFGVQISRIYLCMEDS